MNCENTFCIYCDDDKCILEEININSLGRCDACIIINLSDELLRREKEKLLDKYKNTFGTPCEGCAKCV